MSWLNVSAVACRGFLLLFVFFTGFAHAQEEQFTFDAEQSDIRFSEVEIPPGLPEGIDEKGLRSSDGAQKSEFLSFQYGDPSSRAICIRFDADDPSAIWVDANRDQKFTEEEKHASESESVWFVNLTAEFSSLRRKTSQQRVRIRNDKESSTWFLATAGCRTGKADFDGELRTARIEDRNANGLWFDAEDRLFVDFNDNGKLSGLTERIPAQGMRKVRGKVYAVAGSANGKSVSLAEVKGSGFVTPRLNLFDASAKITSFKGQLGSKSGIGIQIESLDAPIEVPVGQWHVDFLRFEVTGEKGVFLFTFLPSGTKTVVTVADTDQKEFDLLGELELSAGVSVQQENGKSDLMLTPMLTTDTGCFMAASRMGKRSPNNENRLVAHSSSPDRDLEVGSSGFS